MSKRTLMALALALAVAATGCAGTESTSPTSGPDQPTSTALETTTAGAGSIVVGSADGTATIEIPAGALPPGVDPADITIEQIDTDPADPIVSALIEAGFSPGASYRLGPDGLVFAEPALLTVAAAADGRLLAAFIVGDGELEPLEVAAAATGGDDGVVFAVPHFTQVTTAFGPFLAFLSGPSQAIVNVPFAVRSQVVEAVPFMQALTGPKFTFSLSGSLLATAPVEPNLTAAPALTAGLAFFTGVSTLTCAEEGTSKIAHTVLASVPRADLIAYGIEITTGSGADVHLTGMLSLMVECVPPTVETPEIQVSGIYEGALQLTAVTGLPGSDYSDRYDLILEGCGVATLVQRSTQTSLGRFYTTTVGYEAEPAASDFFYAHAYGAGSDYGEVFSFDIESLGDGSVRVSGVTVGGGHGFGELLPEDTLWLYAYMASFEGSVDPERFEGVGWVNSVEGTLTRTGDAPPCD